MRYTFYYNAIIMLIYSIVAILCCSVNLLRMSCFPESSRWLSASHGESLAPEEFNRDQHRMQFDGHAWAATESLQVCCEIISCVF